MRLIDADALQRRICGAKCGCEYEDCENEGDCGYDHFISSAPTVDAVPVVRCRECKFWLNSQLFPHSRYCIRTERVAYPDDFCSYGERKEGSG